VLGPFLDDAMPQDPFVREKFTRKLREPIEGGG
jgi:hypothetical protein